MTGEDVRKIMLEIVDELSEEHQDLVGFYVETVPFKIISGRLKTLGRCVTRKNSYRDVEGVRFEFNKEYLDVASEENIRDVVGHELMHLLTNLEYNTFCKHDARFKKNANMYGFSIGSKSDKIDENYREYLDSKYKYMVYCETCGLVVQKRHRISEERKREFEQSGRFTCKGCGGHHFKVEEL